MGAYMESAMSTWSCLWSFSFEKAFLQISSRCWSMFTKSPPRGQAAKQAVPEELLKTEHTLFSQQPHTSYIFMIFPRGLCNCVTMLCKIFSALLLLNFLLTFFQTSAMTPLQQERLPLMLAVIGDCRSGCLYFQAGGFDWFVIKFPPTVLKKTSVDIFWKYEQLIL